MSNLGCSRKHAYNCEKYLNDTFQDYVLNLKTGLYEQRLNQAASGIRPQGSMADWVGVGIAACSLIISFATLIGLYFTVLFSSKQMQDTHATAIAAIDSARIASIANEESGKQFIQDQRPYLAESANGLTRPILFTNKSGNTQIAWVWKMNNFGKTPANEIVMNQEMSIDGGRNFTPSYGADGAPGGKAHDRGNGQPPSGESTDTVFSAPMSNTEANTLLSSDIGIAIRVRITYKDLAGRPYTSGLCYVSKPSGAIAYCKDNYIR